MKHPQWENLEINLLKQAILERYGYDFTGYAEASIRRRVHATLAKHQLRTISDLTGRVIHDPDFFPLLLENLTVTVTEMFRDPTFYRTLVETVFPYLQTYPELKVWHPGCATGEEVFSTAILLEEAGLYNRTIMYGTDINPRSLARAREGVLKSEALAEATQSYQQAGGKHALSRYFASDAGWEILSPEMKKNLVFSDHNLVTDSRFGEMHLILCRNVLIYFDRPLQDRVLRLLWDSLAVGGFLVLGSRERLDAAKNLPGFSVYSKEDRIYQKKG